MKLNLACLVTFLFGANVAAEELEDIFRVSDKMAERMPEKGSLKNIEASLLGMAANRMKQDPAGNATNTQLDFITTIDNLIEDTMKPNIKNRLKAAQDVLDAAWSGYGICAHPNDDGHLAPLASPLAAHAACRVGQNQIYTTFDERCVLGRHVAEEEHQVVCERYGGLNVFPNPTPCVMEPSTPVPMIGHYLIDMADKFKELYENLLDAHWKCHNITNPCDDYRCGTSRCSYEDKRIECDGLQGVFEEEACEVYKNYTCDKYITCFDASKNTYDEALAAAMETEAALKIEWRAIMRIECLIKAIMKPADEIQAGLDECKATTYTGDEIFITYPGGDLPVKKECTDEIMASLRPSTAQFTSRWYASSPVNGASAPCASSCCGGYIGPSYPTGVVCPYVHANGSFCEGEATNAAAAESTQTDLMATMR